MSAAAETVRATHTGTTKNDLWEDRPVRTGRLLTRRAGPLGLALTAWDLWRRLPPKQRKQVLDLARKHGPKVAARVLKARAAYRDRSR